MQKEFGQARGDAVLPQSRCGVPVLYPVFFGVSVQRISDVVVGEGVAYQVVSEEVGRFFCFGRLMGTVECGDY